jgi:phage terminase large subunit GpA-like protein
MDAITSGLHERVVFIKAAQIAGTELLLNLIGYFIHQDPSPMLVIQPTLQMAEAFSKDRLAPMLRDTPCLQGQVQDPRARDSGNTLLHKTFPGGHVTIAGANSPASLASRPVRVVAFDEVDRYPPSAGTEGDPVNLGRKRSATFWNRVSVEVSTPTVKGHSRIESSYAYSDQREYWVPCPACAAMQRLMWEQVKWDKVDGKHQPDTAHYECSQCAHHFTEPERQDAIQRGEWIAQNPGHAVAGFHISELYSPWSTLPKIAAAFLEAEPRPDTLRTFVNTALAETWEEQLGEGLDADKLYDRLRESYAAPVPSGAVVLTAFVDVQRDRLEAEVVGWGEGFESWSIDYRVIEGDTSRDQVWRELDEYLDTPWAHESGAMLTIAACGVDSGDQTQQVYRYVRTREGRRVWATKGKGGMGLPTLVTRGRRKTAPKVRLFVIGVDGLKSTCYARLQIPDPGPGYCHFPVHYDDHYFEMLTAEKAQTNRSKGHPVIAWVLPAGRRNEALDCRVGNMAMIEILKPYFEKLRTYMLENKRDPMLATLKRKATRRVLSSGVQ